MSRINQTWGTGGDVSVTSPCIQDCLYQALRDELVTQTDDALALHPLDALADVFAPAGLNLPALLTRYTDYQLTEKDLSPTFTRISD